MADRQRISMLIEDGGRHDSKTFVVAAIAEPPVLPFELLCALYGSF